MFFQKYGALELNFEADEILYCSSSSTWQIRETAKIEEDTQNKERTFPCLEKTFSSFAKYPTNRPIFCIRDLYI